MANSFRDLNVWRNGYKLVLQIYSLTNNFPNTERYGLIDQLRRSSNSIIANIAEAHGRYHFADKCRVLYQARGECDETRSHLSVSHGLGFITKKEFERIDLEYEGLAIGINTFIAKMKKS
jgi:four helix bundle protein